MHGSFSWLLSSLLRHSKIQMPASAPDPRTRNICLWLISCLLLGVIIVGCGLLIKYVFFNAPIQVAEIGLTLIAIPWMFWIFTYLYRCISRSCCNPNPSGASAAGGGGMSRRMASMSVSNAQSKRSAAVANDSPVMSPGTAARKVHFGDVIVLNEQDEHKQFGSESDGHVEKTSSMGSSNNDYEDISSPESQVECERPLSTSRPSSYKDSTKTSFKSSTRLECMMQDYPKTLSPSARVGFTVMDPWLAYAPVKNNPEDASKVPKGNPYHSATSGETAIYRANSLILRTAGVQIEDPKIEVFNGQEVEVWPRIVWKAEWGLTFKEIKQKVSASSKISQRSTLVIKGRHVVIGDLDLDGAFVVNSIDQAEVKLEGSVENKGWIIEPVDHKDVSVPEEVRIRGFKISKIEELEKNYSEPGKFSIKS